MASERPQRKLAAILAADVVGYTRLAGADEDRILARLRALRSDLIDPTIAVHNGRVIKRTGDGILIEFRSVVDAVNCAVEVQNGVAERNAGVAEDRQIRFRVGIHLGDVVEESDGDLMGDGVNIAARLEGVAKPGAICLSEDAYRQVKGRLNLAVEDLGATQLKNIAEPIHVYSLEVGVQASPKPAPASVKSVPPRLSIVVLPFANLGGDPTQDYFVDGVTESLTTDLSRISGAFVIARNTAFTYRSKTVDVKQIGQDLNVRYVLEGSVQRGGNRLRVNVQLVEAETGAHLWAERFDKPVADLFDMQDEIVARLANQLQAELIGAEARRAAQAPNPDSMDFCFQGRATLNRGNSPEILAKAREFFERALELDRGNVEALVGVGIVDLSIGSSYMSDDPAPILEAAEANLARALAAVPNHASAHRGMGMVLGRTKRASRAIEEFERALAIDPNFARARATLGLALAFVGRAEETEAHVLEALRLSPRDATSYVWFLHIGGAKAYLAEYEEAVAWLRKSIDANRNNAVPFFYLAACLAHLGRLDEARAEMKAGLAIDPKLTVARFRAGIQSDNKIFLAQRERVIEGMRMAGVPEG
jgi:TolB-like protein/class 3 adenylate cyclase/Tfp pilus assembly protein PilF